MKIPKAGVFYSGPMIRPSSTYCRKEKRGCVGGFWKHFSRPTGDNRRKYQCTSQTPRTLSSSSARAIVAYSKSSSLRPTWGVEAAVPLASAAVRPFPYRRRFDTVLLLHLLTL